MSEDSGSCNIRVVCRVRPLNSKEVALGGEQCVTFPRPNVISVQGANYPFDNVFEPNTTQFEVYDITAKPIIKDVLNGFNGTIFAYGQTASGKTHTMEGNLSEPEQHGITPRIVNDIFDYIYNMDPASNVEFTLKVSYFEVYNEELRDLLDLTKGKLSIHEDRTGRPFVKGLSEHAVGSPEEIMDLIEDGKSNRHVSVTNMNEHSSRSHSVFIFQVCQENIETKRKLLGKLYLVDLAGSEKAKKTGAEGNTLNEAKSINMSLLCLGNVIEGLVLKKSHIPYRDSKLTRILQESLGGNARTTIAICVSPSSFNEMETKNTILFGSRAKTIKNVVIRNEELTADEWKARYNKLKKQYRGIVACLNSVQEEVKRWRGGESVPEEDWSKLAAAPDDKSTAADTPLSDPKPAAESGLLDPLYSFSSAHSSPLPRAPSAPPDWEEEKAQLISCSDRKEEELCGLRQELEEAQESQSELSERSEELLMESDGLKDRLLETENDVAKSHDELLQVISELQKLALTTEELSNDKQATSERCLSLEAELNRERRSAETTQSVYISFKARTGQMLTALFSDLRGLGRTLRSEKSVVFDPESIDSQLSDDMLTRLTIYITDMRSNAQTALQNLATSESSNNELRIKKRDMEKDLEKLKRANRESELKVKKILGQFRMYSAQSEESLHSPLGEQEQMTNLTNQVEKQIDNHKVQLDSVRNELAMKNRILIETEEQVAEREDQIKDLELDLRFYQDGLKEKENKLKQLNSNLKVKSEASLDLYSLSQPLQDGGRKMSTIRNKLLARMKTESVDRSVKNVNEERLKLVEKNFEQLSTRYKEKQKESDFLSQECFKFESILSSKEKQLEKLKQYMETMTDVYEKTVAQFRNEAETLRKAQVQQRSARGRFTSSSSSGPRVAVVKTIRAGVGKLKPRIPEPTVLRRTESGQRFVPAPASSAPLRPLQAITPFPEQAQSKLRAPSVQMSQSSLQVSQTAGHARAPVTPPPGPPKSDLGQKLPRLLRPKTSIDHFSTRPVNGHV